MELHLSGLFKAFTLFDFCTPLSAAYYYKIFGPCGRAKTNLIKNLLRPFYQNFIFSCHFMMLAEWPRWRGLWIRSL